MDELMDMIVSDDSPSQISDRIKDILFGKAAERVDAALPLVANSLFDGNDVEDEEETLEVTDELETEEESEEETV